MQDLAHRLHVSDRVSLVPTSAVISYQSGIFSDGGPNAADFELLHVAVIELAQANRELKAEVT